MSENWIWHQNNREGVAHFINPDVKNMLYIEDNVFDLRNNNRDDLTPVIRLLYNKLKAKGIRYSNEKGMTNDDEAQFIRKPNEILSGNKEGTCLDLALLFCGLCLGHKLLPIFVLLENHALVAISLRFTTSERDSSKRPKKHKNILKQGAVTNINFINELVEEEEYILVECTGFAQTDTISKDYPEGEERVDGFLDFEQAVEAGHKQLDFRNLKFFIEVEMAHRILKVNPYPIHSENSKYNRDEVLANINKKAEEIAEKQLKPEILERIPRSSILDKCLKEIRLGVDGKSVILGNIYEKLRDELVESNNGWVALVRCDDVIDDSVTNFATELGKNASDCEESITKIAEILSNYGTVRGVLLIDTLDILLTKDLVIVLRRTLLPELLKHGATVVFTCRKEDYELYVEPYDESFSGFHQSVKSCKIKEFEDTDKNPEVQTAVRNFFRYKLEVKEQEIIEGYVQEIIELSAHSSSLKEITRNPLLLALLCQLFFSKDKKHEQIPEDLTVSQLYDKYWKQKVTKIRKNSQDSRVGEAMENLCFKIAESMYKKSTDSLHNRIYRKSLSLDNPNTLDKEAYETLKSNGVLKPLNEGGNRITFLHQTFTEYAMARWLAFTESGETAKYHLFNEIVSSSNENYKSYVYPVLRQLLTIEDIENFYDICNRLDKNKPLPFRTIAPASVSRSEPESSSVFCQLLPIACDKGKAYQRELLRAGNSALKVHVETVWEVALKLLQKCDEGLINDVCLRTGKLLGRFDKDTSIYLENALQIIKERNIKNIKNTQNSISETGCNNNPKKESLNSFHDKESGSDNLGTMAKKTKYQQKQKRHFVGSLISEYSKTIKTLKRSVDINTLSVLENYYFEPFFGSETRARIIDIFLHRWLPEDIQRELNQQNLNKAQSEFLIKIIGQPTSDRVEEKEPASVLIKKILPIWLESGNLHLGKSWLSALHARLPKSWYIVQAKAVSLQAIQDTELMQQILKSLLDPNILKSLLDLNPSHENIVCHTIAIKEAICSGAGNLVASELLKIKIEELPKNRISTISTLLKKFPGHLDIEYQIDLAKWFLPMASQNLVEVVTTIDKLAHNSPEVLEILVQLLVNEVIGSTIKQSQKNQIIKKLDHIPEQIQDYLHRTKDISESRLALAKLYKYQTEKYNSEEHFSKLMNLCLDESQKVSLEASRYVLEIAEANKNKISLSVLPEIFLKSNVIGVCENCLKAVTKIVKIDSYNSHSEIDNICSNLVNNKSIDKNFDIEKWIKVIKSWYKLIEIYVSFHRSISPQLFNLTLEFTNKIITQSKGESVNGGIAASAFMTLKNIANLENKALMSQLGELTRHLFRSTNMNSSGDNSFAIGLLDKIARFDEEFLSTIYKEDFLREDGYLPTPNMQVVVVAIAHNQGKTSDLFVKMLDDKRICEQVKNTIRQEQGY